MKRQTVTLWVCVDCYVTHHGIADEGDPSHTPDRPPLSMVGEYDELSAGLLWSEHADDCPNRRARACVDECECERDTFSSRSCDGCGSTLAGEREALTAWYVPAPTPVDPSRRTALEERGGWRNAVTWKDAHGRMHVVVELCPSSYWQARRALRERFADADGWSGNYGPSLRTVGEDAHVREYVEVSA